MAMDFLPEIKGSVKNSENKLCVKRINHVITEEESTGSESDDERGIEVMNTNTVQTLSTVPSLDLSPSPSTAVGSVAISNSENVHFGNKTYFNGPITIKQYVNAKNGIDNAGYSKSDEPHEKENESQDKTTTKVATTVKGNKINTWQKILLSIIIIILFGVVCSVIFTLYAKSLQNESESKDNSVLHTKKQDNGPLPILPSSKVLRMVQRNDWLAQPVEKPLDPMKHPVPWVIIAHTATESCNIQSECILRVRVIQSYHIESRGWYDIGYNFLVGGDGSVYVGRGWDSVGAHTLGYNDRSIGIAFIGTFNNEDPPPRQVEACVKLIQLGVTLGKLSADYLLLAHRQLMSTLSPGDQVYDLISKWPHFASNITAIKINSKK